VSSDVRNDLNATGADVAHAMTMSTQYHFESVCDNAIITLLESIDTELAECSVVYDAEMLLAEVRQLIPPGCQAANNRISMFLIEYCNNLWSQSEPKRPSSVSSISAEREVERRIERGRKKGSKRGL
jgi:hypothetical protein